MNISYDYYRIFYFVAKCKSFTGAAKLLMNNQPNITRMIKNLEEGLGCTLFIRQHHGVTLTEEGKKLFSHVSVAYENIVAGEEEIIRDNSLQSGTVTIAASDIALHCILLPVIKKFRSQYPGVKIHISTHPTPQAAAMQKNHLADLALITSPLKPETGLESIHLRYIQEVAICSTASPLAGTSILPWSELAEHPLISLGEDSSSFPFFSDFFSRMGLLFAPAIEASAADQVLPLVKSDLGIGFVPLDFLRQDAMGDNLVILNTETPIPRREICLLKHNRAALSSAARELARMLRTYAEQTEHPAKIGN